VLIGGGETTVKIAAKPGRGGRIRSFPLVPPVAGQVGEVVVIGLDSDGSDGPTDFAGGIGDNFSVGRARELGIDLFAC
jgi:glycerate-2-kinase